MSDDELEKIKKLPPAERIKKLEELKKKRAEEKKKKEEREKKNALEAQKIISESLKEIELDKMLQEIEVPKKDPIRIDDIFSEEEFEEENKRKSSESGGTSYGKQLEGIFSEQSFNQIQDWYKKDSVELDKNQFMDAYNNAKEAYNAVMENSNNNTKEKYSPASEKMKNEVISSIKMLRSMGYDNNFFE